MSDEQHWHPVQGRSSYVWQFFERRRMAKSSESGKSFSEFEHRCAVFVVNPDGTLQRCHKVKQTSDTSNLHAHLAKEHAISKDNFTNRLGLLVEETARDILSDVGACQHHHLPGIKESPHVAQRMLTDRSFVSTDALHASIAALAAKNAMPLSIFESPAFDSVLRAAKRHKSSHVEPRIIAAKVNEIAKWTEDAIIMRVNEMEFVSLSFERGTDSASRGLMTFCLHTIEDVMFAGDPEPDWMLRDIQLDTVQVSEDPTEEELAMYAGQVLRKYNIGEKLVAIVSERSGSAGRVLKGMREAAMETEGTVRLQAVVGLAGVMQCVQGCVSGALGQDRPQMVVNNIFSLVDGCRKVGLVAKEMSRLMEAVGQAYSDIASSGQVRFAVVLDVLETFLRVYPFVVTLTGLPAGRLLADLVPSAADKAELEEMVQMLRVVRERSGALVSTPYSTLGHCAVALFGIARTMGEFERKARAEYVRTMAASIRTAVQGLLEPGEPGSSSSSSGSGSGSGGLDGVGLTGVGVGVGGVSGVVGDASAAADAAAAAVVAGMAGGVGLGGLGGVGLGGSGGSGGSGLMSAGVPGAKLLAVAAGLHPLLKDGAVHADKKRAKEWSTAVRDLLVTAIKQTEGLYPRASGPLGRPVSPPMKRQYVSREKDMAHVQFVEELKSSGAIVMGPDPMGGPAAAGAVGGAVFTEADEVDDYMDLHNEEFAREEFSLLKFWAMMGHTQRFPRLARLARRVFSVPASTTGVERALEMVKRHLPNVADPNDSQAIHALLLVSRNEIQTDV